MVEAKLDPQEAELLRSYEAGEWHTIDDFDTEARMYAQYAHAAFKKDGSLGFRRIKTRNSPRTLRRGSGQVTRINTKKKNLVKIRVIRGKESSTC